MAKNWDKYCVAYTRTSSKTNVGKDKDSIQRQLISVQNYAKSQEMKIKKVFSDNGVSGTIEIYHRKSFMEMLNYCSQNNIKQICVDGADRIARDLLVQMTCTQYLSKQGYQLINVQNPDTFSGKSPTSDLIAQILGAISQYEKNLLVAKLKGARDRKKLATKKKVEGRKNWSELSPKTVRITFDLRKKGKTMKEISVDLASKGYLSTKNTPINLGTISRILQSKG